MVCSRRGWLGWMDGEHHDQQFQSKVSIHWSILQVFKRKQGLLGIIQVSDIDTGILIRIAFPSSKDINRDFSYNSSDKKLSLCHQHPSSSHTSTFLFHSKAKWFSVLTGNPCMAANSKGASPTPCPASSTSTHTYRLSPSLYVLPYSQCISVPHIAIIKSIL